MLPYEKKLKSMDDDRCDECDVDDADEYESVEYGLYVAADVVPVYRSLLPFSTIITPNWFEVE